MEGLSVFGKARLALRDDGLKGLGKRVLCRVRSCFQPVRLLSVAVELTNVCDLRCRFCFVGERKLGYMSFGLFRKIVDEADSLGVEHLCLYYGGESLCHPEFMRFLKYAVKVRDFDGSGLKTVGWVDNGMRFNREISDLTVELGVDEVGFSLEGFASVNDVERVGCDYNVVHDNIMYLMEKRGSAKKPMVHINTLNLAGDSEFIRYWMHRVDCVYWQNLIGEGNVVDSAFFAGQQFTPKHCWSPFSFMGVLWDGTVTACCADGAGSMNLGNLNNQSIREVWNGRKFDAVRYGPFPALCHSCTIWKNQYVPSVKTVFDGEGDVLHTLYHRIYRRRNRC